MPDTNSVNKTPEDNYNQREKGNEISTFGKFLAGVILISLTTFSALYIIGHWPDRLPEPKQDIMPLYKYEWFHVELANIPDTLYIEADSLPTQSVAEEETSIAKNDSAAIATDSVKTPKVTTKAAQQSRITKKPEKLLHINTILLIMVAFGGFLGNMIYVSTSFTTFIGNGKFSKNWLLWYCVKPFTASALAIAIYFVFRGGFLNMSDNSTNINLYGVMTLSLMAGLFTDRATLKLKEVFDVLLRPKDDRSGKLDGNGKTNVPATGQTGNSTTTGKEDKVEEESIDNSITKPEDIVPGEPDENEQEEPTVKA